MVAAGIKPNVRTFTALMTAFGTAREWERALSLLRSMRTQAGAGGVEPNAYTYSALIKAMGEQVCPGKSPSERVFYSGDFHTMCIGVDISVLTPLHLPLVSVNDRTESILYDRFVNGQKRG